MNYVCRLCLKETTTYIKINQKDRTGVTTRSLITALVPELYLGVSINPLVCKNCYLYLRQAYSFRLQCLRSENLIGIFIRETKNTNSIIMLEDVVDFWKKDYKEKGKEAEGNWEEWFGNMEGSGSEDVTAVGSFRHQKQEDGDIQKKRTVSELDLEKEKTADCTTACPDNEDDSSCNSIKSQEGKEKTGIERPIAADDDLILVENAAAEFSVPETETIKSIDKTSPVQTYTEKCNTLKVTKNTEATTEDELVKDTDRQESTNGKTTQVELIDDLNDEDISNLLDELQKGENLKKLGFPTPHTDGREKYVLKKFIDKSDNRLSFAFLPEVSSADEDEFETDSYVDETDPLQENVTKDPEDARMKDNFMDSMKTKLNRLVTVKQKSMELTAIRDARGRKRKLEESIDDTSVELCPNRRVNEESKNNFEEVNADSDKSEGFVLSPLVDERESENGFVMVPCDPERPPDPLPSTSQDKPSANPRPIIRVRPVSALQKVRTLNHELWPQTQASGNVKDPLERSHSSPKPSSDTSPVPYGLPPIVLNTQLEFPKPNTVIEKTNPQPPLTSANPAIPKTVRRTIPAPTVMHSLPTSNKPATPKTYHRKATGGPRILKRVNPLTFKTLEEMQKLGLIKVMLPSDEPQTESIQLSVLNESLLKSSRNSLRNYGDSRDNPGDHPGNSGDSLGISRDGLDSFGDGMRASRDERNDEVIDIKQEPLSSIGNDVLMNCGTEDHSTESEGESTRSASETSIMDSFIAQSELVKTIVDSIPEVGEEMYDVPEYVHINKVTFSDLAKLVGESKIHRENVEKAQMQSNAESPKSLNLEIKVQNSEQVKTAKDLPKYCFVPNCPSSTVQNPAKIFFVVPTDNDLQKLWCEAVGRKFPGFTTQYFCCEDHFDLEEDMAHYKLYKKFKGRALLKKGILPDLKRRETVFSTLESKPSQDGDMILTKALSRSCKDTGSAVDRKQPPNKSDNNKSPDLSPKPLQSHKNKRQKLKKTRRQQTRLKKLKSSIVPDKIQSDIDSTNPNPTVLYRKNCFVPGCDNTSLSHPDKIFIQCPKDQGENKKWLQAVGLKFPTSTRMYCCEDHFDIEQDFKIYTVHRKSGHSVVRKTAVVPHKGLTFRTNFERIINTGELSKPKQLDSGISVAETLCKQDLSEANEELNDTETLDPSPERDLIRYCFAPGCNTNSYKHPDKLYVLIGSRKLERQLWLTALNQPPASTIRGKMFYCENHFTINEGMELLVRDKKYGGIVPQSFVTPKMSVKLEPLVDSVREQGYSDATVEITETDTEKYDVPRAKAKVNTGSRISSKIVKKVINYCFVPGCPTYSTTFLSKTLLLKVPSDDYEQKRWVEAVGRTYDGAKENLWCCENHFDKQDIIQQVGPPTVKRGIVPHKFPEEPSLIKHCFVPNCSNDSQTHPEKIFVNVPKDQDTIKWFAAVRRKYFLNSQRWFCCEDHFNIEEDMLDYQRYKANGGLAVIKKGILPYKRIPKPVYYSVRPAKKKMKLCSRENK